MLSGSGSDEFGSRLGVGADARLASASSRRPDTVRLEKSHDDQGRNNRLRR
jgi:hypothetical protein